jgi:nucleotide-binding universal stress UspA family protein
MVGRKQGFKGSDLNEKKLAKASPTSVIMVPERPSFNFNNIVVSVDYSEHSRMAFEIGRGIQKKTGAKLLSSNVYTVPRGYHAQGKTFEEFAEIMLTNTKHECDKFFKKMDLDGADFEHTFSLDNDQHPADKIYLVAKENNAKQEVQTALSLILPKRLAQFLVEKSGIEGKLADLSHKKLEIVGRQVNEWRLTPNGTEGFAIAEVTRGGVNTAELSSKTFESSREAGLYFIGEVVDVTGHLGGFNFQWAWASGHAAGQFV